MPSSQKYFVRFSVSLQVLAIGVIILIDSEAIGQQTRRATTEPVDFTDPRVVARELFGCMDKGEPERIILYVIDDKDGQDLAVTAAQFRQLQLLAIEIAKAKLGADGETVIRKYSNKGAMAQRIGSCKLNVTEQTGEAELVSPSAPMYPLRLKKVAGEWKVDFASSLRFGMKTATEVDVKATIAVNEIGANIWRSLIIDLDSGKIKDLAVLESRLLDLLRKAKIESDQRRLEAERTKKGGTIKKG